VAGKDFWKAHERDQQIGWLIVLEGKVIKEERAYSKSAACQRRNASSNCLQQQGSLVSPFPVSPSRGKAGAGGFPPRRWHAARQQKALAPIDAARLPPQGGVQSASLTPPLRIPPMGASGGAASHMVSLDLRDRPGENMKDGRHVGLDFYDLLIEALTEHIGSVPAAVGWACSGPLQ
jgi:hypothetical protein